ncbi:restriction endonuclease subunit S [Planktomarina temperata]|nr:restriction endonuclease subunit S [Planktomarina temperata]
MSSEFSSWNSAECWLTSSLGNLFDISTGKLDANAAETGGEYPFFTCSDEVSQINSYAFDCQAVLLAGNGGFHVKKYEGKFNAYQRTYVLKPKELDLDFAFLLVQFLIGKITAPSRGSTIQYLRIGDITSVQAVYPHSRKVQKRIAENLNHNLSILATGISSLELGEKQLELYRQSVLKDAFEGKLTADWRASNPDLVEPTDKLLARIENERKAAHQAELDAWEDAVNQWEVKGKDGKKPSKPKNLKPIENPPITQGDKCSDTWCDVKFSDVFNVTGGLTKNADKRKQLTLQMKYLSVANVYADTLKLDNINIIGVTKAEFDKVRLKFGDILIVEGNGSKDQIGRAAIWRDEFPNCGHQNHLIRGRALGSISPEFIMHFLLSGIGRQGIMDVASSTSGLYTLSISKIDSLIIPCTSRTEQDEIVRKLDEILQSCAKVRANIVELRQRSESLKQSILKQAFSGHELLEDAS